MVRLWFRTRPGNPLEDASWLTRSLLLDGHGALGWNTVPKSRLEIEERPMEADVVRIIVIVVTVVGAVVWLAGLLFMLRAARERQAWAHQAAERFEINEPDAGSAIVGESEIDGKPEELAEKLARVLARDGLGPLGPVKIVSCDPHEVVFHAADSSAQPTGGFRGGRVRLTPFGSRTRVEYALETSSGRVLIALGWLFVVLGLLALAAGCFLMFAYVLPSANPGVRSQAIQIVQVVHFLWPPFLFGALSRQPARFLRARMEALVNNLPYA
jgi:hypothetical protein